MKRKIEPSLLLIFLTFGFIISSIGVTLCRYEVKKQIPITYKVKGFADLYIKSDRSEWIFNEETGLTEFAFTVSNINPDTNEICPTSHNFYVRYLSNLDTSLYLPLESSSGREMHYESSKTYIEESNQYLYSFFDENGTEIMFDVQGNVASENDFTLQAPQQKDAFIGELIIVDASYDVEATKDYITSQYYPLEADSNYLSEDEVINVIFDDNIDITLMTNENIKSKFIAKTDAENIEINLSVKPENVAVQNITNNELEINVEANNEVAINLSYSPLEDELQETLELEETQDVIIEVEWQLFNASNEIEKILKGNFIISSNNVVSSQKPEELIMEYIDDTKKSFSQYQPLEFYLTSPIDTVVQIKDSLISQYTRYSLDQGESWYILTKADSINLSLTANEKAHVMIDLCLADNQWLEQSYELSVYHSDEMITSLEFNMTRELAEDLYLVSSNTGIINEEDISFVINDKEIDLSIQYLQNNRYEDVNYTHFFEILTQNEVEFRVKMIEDVAAPKGTYQITIKNKKGQEVRLAFFVIETEQSEVEQ